jgi:hypothetical protein
MRGVQVVFHARGLGTSGALARGKRALSLAERLERSVLTVASFMSLLLDDQRAGRALAALTANAATRCSNRTMTLNIAPWDVYPRATRESLPLPFFVSIRTWLLEGV